MCPEWAMTDPKEIPEANCNSIFDEPLNYTEFNVFIKKFSIKNSIACETIKNYVPYIISDRKK